MPPQTIDESTLYKKCLSELEAIRARNQSEGPDSHSVFEVADECHLFLFISRDKWTNLEQKPDIAAFGKAEMSVEAADGPFGSTSKREIKKKLLAVQAATNQDFAGVVSFRVGDIHAHEDLNFYILHDPNPFLNSKGEKIPQSPTHCQILCDKRKSKPRTGLWDLCSVYISPGELEKISISEIDQLIDFVLFKNRNLFIVTVVFLLVFVVLLLILK